MSGSHLWTESTRCITQLGANCPSGISEAVPQATLLQSCGGNPLPPDYILLHPHHSMSHSLPFV